MRYLRLPVLFLFIFNIFFFSSAAAITGTPFTAGCTDNNLKAYGRGLAGQNALCSDNPTNNPLLGQGGTLTNVINIISIVAGVAAVIMIIIGGFMFVTANGDSQRVNSAKNTLIYALVGIIVVILARFIIMFVIDRVT